MYVGLSVSSCTWRTQQRRLHDTSNGGRAVTILPAVQMAAHLLRYAASLAVRKLSWRHRSTTQPATVLAASKDHAEASLIFGSSHPTDLHAIAGNLGTEMVRQK